MKADWRTTVASRLAMAKGVLQPSEIFHRILQEHVRRRTKLPLAVLADEGLPSVNCGRAHQLRLQQRFSASSDRLKRAEKPRREPAIRRAGRRIEQLAAGRWRL